MIASIQGKLASTGSDSVVVVVGGIGLKIFIPFSTKDRLKDDDVFLHTHLIVREDALTLYGFSTIAERDMFQILITVQGVGPRLALAMLSTMTIDNLRNAVASERPELLQRVPGIGKKIAQKIVIELKDKLMSSDSIPIDIIQDDINSDVMDTLVALGYSIVEAQTAIQALPKDAPKNVEDRVRLALQNFA